MSELWDQARLQAYVSNEVEESHKLEYKGAGALGRNNKEKDEITKDVSAMANADGGIIIFGIAEYQEDSRRHLPSSLEPIDRIQYSREWLGQIINTVQPVIEGVVIHSVSLDSGENHVAYVIEVPQASTAHQARDKRYYQRMNFEVLAMHDNQIRDVMGRAKNPRLEVEMWIDSYPSSQRDTSTRGKNYIRVRITNVGTVLAHYVSCIMYVPISLVTPLVETYHKCVFDDQYCLQIHKQNKVGDVFDPILPKMNRTWSFDLTPGIDFSQGRSESLHFELFADNASPIVREIAFAEIEYHVV